jgi:hypothetical protein
MRKIIIAVLMAGSVADAQTGFEIPMLGQALPSRQFELVNHIPDSKLAQLPKELPVFKWSHEPRGFSSVALEQLLRETAFAGTNLASFLHSSNDTTTVREPIKLASADNQNYFVVLPAGGRITIRNAPDRTREAPPPDAVPSFDVTVQRALRLAEMLGVSTNEMERRPDGSIHVRKAEDTTRKLGGSVSYKSRRSVTLFRNIAGYLARGLDEDNIELELGVDGRLLKFNFKWPPLEVVSTNKVLNAAQIIDRIKSGTTLGEVTNEYPADGIARIELTDFQIFYYIPAPFPYGRDSTSGGNIRPMIEFLASFKSSKGETTEGGLFAPMLESP